MAREETVKITRTGDSVVYNVDGSLNSGYSPLPNPDPVPIPTPTPVPGQIKIATATENGIVRPGFGLYVLSDGRLLKDAREGVTIVIGDGCTGWVDSYGNWYEQDVDNAGSVIDLPYAMQVCKGWVGLESNRSGSCMVHGAQGAGFMARNSDGKNLGDIAQEALEVLESNPSRFSYQSGASVNRVFVVVSGVDDKYMADHPEVTSNQMADAVVAVMNRLRELFTYALVDIVYAVDGNEPEGGSGLGGLINPLNQGGYVLGANVHVCGPASKMYGNGGSSVLRRNPVTGDYAIPYTSRTQVNTYTQIQNTWFHGERTYPVNPFMVSDTVQPAGLRLFIGSARNAFIVGTLTTEDELIVGDTLFQQGSYNFKFTTAGGYTYGAFTAEDYGMGVFKLDADGTATIVTLAGESAIPANKQVHVCSTPVLVQ